jgi:hypothetical protein
MSKKLFALIALATAVVVASSNHLIDFMSGWPLWLLWGILIGLGNAIYTTVKRNDHIETISLMMAMILLALLNLSWPDIALATIIGVGLGELFKHKPWYKKAYSISAITIAAVITEIVYTYTAVDTIMVSAIIMDVLLFTFYVPIWLWVAGQTSREITDSYWTSFWTVPVSAVIALGINELSSYQYGIAAIAIMLILFLRPRYEVTVRVPARIGL